MKRCFGDGKPFYERYHDEEWGVPSHDERHLFEMLILEGQQAGLSWEHILKRREAYQRAFYNFDPEKVVKMSDQELEAQLHNADLIRNRKKIFSVRQNGAVFLEIQKEHGSFATYLWSFVKGVPIVNSWKKFSEVPCTSQEGDALSKDLKKRGMTFVGPKIIYSYMQAVGLINDHLESCPKKRKCTILFS